MNKCYKVSLLFVSEAETVSELKACAYRLDRDSFL